MLSLRTTVTMMTSMRRLARRASAGAMSGWRFAAARLVGRGALGVVELNEEGWSPTRRCSRKHSASQVHAPSRNRDARSPQYWQQPSHTVIAAIMAAAEPGIISRTFNFLSSISLSSLVLSCAPSLLPFFSPLLVLASHYYRSSCSPIRDPWRAPSSSLQYSPRASPPAQYGVNAGRTWKICSKS